MEHLPPSPAFPLISAPSFTSEATPEPRQQAAASANGRAIGVLFFAFFGAAWLSQALVRLGWWTGWTAAGLVAGTLALFVPAVIVMRQTAALARSARPTAETKRMSRVFLLVNVLQWAAIIAAANLLPYFHHADFVVPVIVFIIGLHMFPLAKLYRYPLHHLTGALLVGSAVGSVLFFAEPLRDTFCCGCAGLIIWGSAAATLRLARQRAKQAAGS